jgi:hypothetical protein
MSIFITTDYPYLAIAVSHADEGFTFSTRVMDLPKNTKAALYQRMCRVADVTELDEILIVKDDEVVEVINGI